MSLNSILAEKLLSYYKKSGSSGISLRLLAPIVEKINEDGAAYALWFILEHEGKITKSELERCKDPWLISKLMLLKERYDLIEADDTKFSISSKLFDVLDKFFFNPQYIENGLYSGQRRKLKTLMKNRE